MSQAKSNTKMAETRWKSLYKVGGAAALVISVLYVIGLIGFIAAGPPPSTINGWFTLFQNARLLGLFYLGLLDIVAFALMVPMFLAIYAALRRANESYSALATTLAFVGIALYYATNTVFSMLYLSDQYAAATTDAQRSLFLAAGQAMLAIGFQGTGAYMWSILWSAGVLIISAVMLRSNIFSKATAYVGILANAVGLAYYPLAFAPAAGALLLLASGLLLLIWFFLIGRRLYQLGRLEIKTLAQQS